MFLLDVRVEKNAHQYNKTQQQVAQSCAVYALKGFQDPA